MCFINPSSIFHLEECDIFYLCWAQPRNGLSQKNDTKQISIYWINILQNYTMQNDIQEYDIQQIKTNLIEIKHFNTLQNDI